LSQLQAVYSIDYLVMSYIMVWSSLVPRP